MCINNNPTLNGYHPKNGNHISRSKQLQGPNSCVPANFAHEVNAYGSHMPLPYDHGGNVKMNNNSNYRTPTVNGHYLEQIGDGVWESRADNPYDYYGNGQFNDGEIDGTFSNTNDARFVNYGGEYGRHKRTFNHTSKSRFDPTRNSYNHIDYGFVSHQ